MYAFTILSLFLSKYYAQLKHLTPMNGFSNKNTTSVQAMLLKDRFFAPASAPEKAPPYANKRSSKNLSLSPVRFVDAYRLRAGG